MFQCREKRLIFVVLMLNCSKKLKKIIREILIKLFCSSF